MPAVATQEPEDLDLTIPGPIRRWLAEVLWQEARRLDADARSAGKVRARNLRHRAEELRLMGSEIVP
jgi:hypothetical protein